MNKPKDKLTAALNMKSLDINCLLLVSRRRMHTNPILKHLVLSLLANVFSFAIIKPEMKYLGL